MKLQLTDDYSNFNPCGIALKIIPQNKAEAQALIALAITPGSIKQEVTIHEIPSPFYLSVKVQMKADVTIPNQGKLFVIGMTC